MFPGDKRPSRDQHLPPRRFVDRRGGIFFHVETPDDADPAKTWRESVVRSAIYFRIIFFSFLKIRMCKLLKKEKRFSNLILELFSILSSLFASSNGEFFERNRREHLFLYGYRCGSPVRHVEACQYRFSDRRRESVRIPRREPEGKGRGSEHSFEQRRLENGVQQQGRAPGLVPGTGDQLRD